MTRPLICNKLVDMGPAGAGDSCVDKFKNCHLVVQARLCKLKYYLVSCCASCSKPKSWTQLNLTNQQQQQQTKASPSAKKGKILFFGSKCSLKEKYSCPEAAAESKIGHWICLVSVRDVLIRARNEFLSFYYIPHNMILLKGTQNKLSSKIIIISPLPGGKSIGNQSDNICITSMTSAIVNTWRNYNSKMRAVGCRFTLVTKQMTRNLFNNYLHCHYGPQQVKY